MKKLNNLLLYLLAIVVILASCKKGESKDDLTPIPIDYYFSNPCLTVIKGNYHLSYNHSIKCWITAKSNHDDVLFVWSGDTGGTSFDDASWVLAKAFCDQSGNIHGDPNYNGLSYYNGPYGAGPVQGYEPTAYIHISGDTLSIPPSGAELIRE